MSVVIVIPARFQSSRYPGKPLVELRGAGGAARKTLWKTPGRRRNEAWVTASLRLA